MGGGAVAGLVVPLALLLLCLVAGVLVEGAASSFHAGAGFGSRPRCRSCGRPVALVALIPLLGLARYPCCAACGRALWRRALATQAGTALAIAAVGLHIRGRPGPLAIALVETALFLVVFVVDLDLRLIPTAPVALLALLGLGGRSRAGRRPARWRAADLPSPSSRCSRSPGGSSSVWRRSAPEMSCSSSRSVSS